MQQRILIVVLTVSGQGSVKKNKRQIKTSESSKKKQRLQSGASFVQEGGAFKDPLENTGELFCCFTFPVFVGTNQNLRKSGGSGYLLGNLFHNEGNTNIGTGGVFLGFFSLSA